MNAHSPDLPAKCSPVFFVILQRTYFPFVAPLDYSPCVGARASDQVSSLIEAYLAQAGLPSADTVASKADVDAALAKVGCWALIVAV